MNTSNRSFFILSAAIFVICAAWPTIAEEPKATAPVEAVQTPAKAPETVKTPENVVEPSAKVIEAPAKAPEAVAIPVKTPEPVAKAAETPVKTPEPAVKVQDVSAKTPEPAPAPKKEKELSGCAQPLLPLADGYRQAQEDMMKWINEASDQTKAADERVNKIQTQIQENEALITKLKFEATKENKTRIKDLTKDNKQLWKDLGDAKREKTALCKSLSRTAAQKVRENNDSIKEKLKEVQSQLQ